MLELHLTCPYCGKEFTRYDMEIAGEERAAGSVCPRCHNQMQEWDYLDVVHAYLTLCDIDERLNHDDEAVPLPPEKQGWKFEIKQG